MLAATFRHFRQAATTWPEWYVSSATTTLGRMYRVSRHYGSTVERYQWLPYVEMDWFGNGHDDANSRAVQSLVIGQHDPSGAAVEVANIIGVYLSAGSAGSAKTVIGVGVPFFKRCPRYNLCATDQ